MATKKRRVERKGGREQWDGQRIKEIREERRLSQNELAERSETSGGDISRHERNDPMSNPSVDVMVRIADALRVPLAALFEPVGSPIPGPERATATGVPQRQHGSEIPDLERLVLGRLDREAPADETVQGDILRAQHALASAQAALNRALRRAAERTGAA